MDGEQGDPTSDQFPGDRRVETWKPGIGISIVWTLISTILTVGSLIALIVLDRSVFGSAWGPEGGLFAFDDTGEGGFSVTVDALGFVLLIGVGTAILFVHEAVHGAAFRYYGGRPIFGAALHNKVLPVLYASAPGYTFTRGQFAVIVLAPAVVITGIGLLLMPLTGLGLWLTVPMAINFGGAIGDFWFAGMLLTKPPGTRIEDLKDGLRFYYPA